MTYSYHIYLKNQSSDPGLFITRIAYEKVRNGLDVDPVIFDNTFDNVREIEYVGVVHGTSDRELQGLIWDIAENLKTIYSSYRCNN